MLAQTMVDNVARQLAGLKIGDTSVQANEDTLLGFLNMAKNKIAIDTLTWLSGETIAMTTANEYTLVTTPIQIIDVYDENLNIRQRNSAESKGYYQLSPSVIYINNPESGIDLKVNYYYTPPDYIITDTLDIPPSLLEAVQMYMTHKAYDIYKGVEQQQLAVQYLERYMREKDAYLSNTDNGNLDTIIDIDLIYQRGLV
jgi:hypothetical protein